MRPQQAAAIPIRRKGADLEVCLITTKVSNAWSIPKGMVDEGDSHVETALKEAWEEAGIRGRVVGDALGTYKYEKWGATLVVKVYLMEVLEEVDDWEEAGIRQRKWTSFDKATALLIDHPAHAFLDAARRLFTVQG
jgi:phosphohistidine phosphatase